MRARKYLAAIGAAALVATPTLAAANPAAPLSVSSSARASADNGGASQLAGGGGIFAVLALGAIIVGAIIIGESGDDNPSSP